MVCIINIFHLQEKTRLARVEKKMAEIVKKLPENSDSNEKEDATDMSLDLLIEV